MKPEEIITNKILELLERGTVPWRQSWVYNWPANYASGREYNGINTLLLASQERQYNYWLTFKQVQELGGYLQTGCHGVAVVYWRILDFERKVNNETGPEIKLDHVPFMRYYTVFNIQDTKGIDYEKEIAARKVETIQSAAEIVDNMPNRPEITHGAPRACYIPLFDKVEMPNQADFDADYNYYSVLFHELVHSTGHKSRLARNSINVNFRDSDSYSKEELIAEIGAAFLSNRAGIIDKTLENSASYVNSWLKALKNDKKMVIFAASAAQKAANYILNKAEVCQN